MSKKLKGFVSLQHGEARETFFTKRSIERLSEYVDLTFTDSTVPLKTEQLCEELKGKGYEVILNGWGTAPIDANVLEAAPELKLVAYTAGSCAAFVTDEMFERGVTLIGGNKVFAMSVAEAAIGYMMFSLRNIEYYLNSVRTGGWRADDRANGGLFHKRIGIVGYGTIGKYVAQYLQPFTPELYIYDKFVPRETIEKMGKYSTLEEIFEECDIITLHLAKNPGTFGMISRELLEKLRPNQLLVNTARGAIIDEAAMRELLVQGRFRAALDVFVKEPLAPDDPLRTCPNVMIQPHKGGPTIDMREVVTFELTKDIGRFIRGEQLEHSISLEYARQMTQ